MRTVPHNFKSWPRTKGGDPIFNCSESAIFYAHLIIDNETQRLKVAHLRQKSLSESKAMMGTDYCNMQRMMDQAVKGQFYRECLEEVERIEKEGA